MNFQIHHGQQLPSSGILSRTVVLSPMVHTILAAFLRDRNHNDVVFVGENYIQLKEYISGSGDCYLEDILTKSDFDAKILGAKVIGQPFRGNIEITSFSEADEPSLYRENWEDWPINILVLALGSQELLFICGSRQEGSHQSFLYERRALPPNSYGRHIAVDPKSRAMAVSTGQDTFGMVWFKPASEIISEVEQGRLNVIRKMRFSKPVNGVILFIDFLCPQENDIAILLLIISRDQSILGLCYFINVGETQEASDSLPSPTREITLPVNCHLPSILIPLMKPASFLIFTPTNLCMYENLLNPELNPVVHSLEGKYRRNEKTWTAWARPRRTRHHLDDDIYVCREDGEILYLEINNGYHMLPLIQHEAGAVQCSLDTGFAIIDDPAQNGDILVAAGSMGDGELFLAAPRNRFQSLQKLSNWAPIADSALIPTEQSSRPTDFDDSIPFHRLFTCSGDLEGNGSLTEVRFGFKGKIGLDIGLEEDSFPALGIWTVNNDTDGIFVLCSNPFGSKLLSIPISESEFPQYLYDKSGLELGSKTLAFESTASGIVVQVTESAIVLTILDQLSLTCSSSCTIPERNVILAHIYGHLSLMIFITRTDAGMFCRLRKIGTEVSVLSCPEVGSPVPLSYEPTSLVIEPLGSGVIAVIGSNEGQLFIYSVDPEESGLTLLSKYDIIFPGTDERVACESTAMISASGSNPETLILFCGLRNGYLSSFKIEIDRELLIIPARSFKVGETPVRLGASYPHKNRFAVFTCGSSLFRLSYLNDEGIIHYCIENIWLVNEANQAYIQSSIDSFTFIDPSASDGRWGSLLLYTEGSLLFCKLDEMPTTVLRHIPLAGSPRRMVYSNRLKKLIVAYKKVRLTQKENVIERRVIPYLDIIDPDWKQSDQFPGIDGLLPSGGSGQEISALLDWTYLHEGKQYNFIILGLISPNSDKKGRMVYVSVKRNSMGGIEMIPKDKHIRKYPDPVRDIVRYSGSSLAIATGESIIILTFNPSTRKWQESSPYRVESAPISLSVKEPYIYASTSKNSVCIIKVKDSGDMTLHAQEGVDRAGIAHVNFHDESIILAATQSGSIVGLSEAKIQPEEQLIPTIFRAQMPLFSSRLVLDSHPARSKGAYGFALDGTIYHFKLLGAHELELLQFIQACCEKDTSICSIQTRDRTQNSHLTRLRSRHVNGDILERVVDRGTAYFRKIMVINNSPEPHFGTPTAQRFYELAVPVVGEETYMYSAVISWMISLLRISF